MSKFLVWNPETSDEDDANLFEAFSAEAAASAWAEREDSHSAEYLIVGGHIEPVVCVRPEGTGDVERFQVRGEPSAVYFANRVKP